MCKPGMASPTALEESYTQKKELRDGEGKSLIDIVWGLDSTYQNSNSLNSKKVSVCSLKVRIKINKILDHFFVFKCVYINI